MFSSQVGSLGIEALNPPSRPSRMQTLIVYSRRGGSGGRSYDGSNARKSDKGGSYKNNKRRRGRPAWLRSPDDTPLRDGNRDRLMGLLTNRSDTLYLLLSFQMAHAHAKDYRADFLDTASFDDIPCDFLVTLSFRASKTLLYYFFELNPTLYGWFTQYMKDHPIPKDGNWDDISGETFLRELMAQAYTETSWGQQRGLPEMYDCTGYLGVDPRNIAQRIMEIRSQIAKEWIEELKAVSEENALLMRESLVSSFSLENVTVAEPGNDANNDGFVHPEMMMDPEVDDSAAGADD
jgi:hypothetical protein